LGLKLNPAQKRVPHPFTQSVKGARGDHHNLQKHLHSRKKREGFILSNAKGDPGSAFWNLGLGLLFRDNKKNSTVLICAL
jgi:hypothetical protein